MAEHPAWIALEAKRSRKERLIRSIGDPVERTRRLKQLSTWLEAESRIIAQRLRFVDTFTKF